MGTNLSQYPKNIQSEEPLSQEIVKQFISKNRNMCNQSESLILQR